MQPTRTDIINVLESFMLRCPQDQRDTTRTTLGPLSVRLTQVPSPVTNLVGLEHPTEYVSDQTLLEVREYFAARRVPFGWLVGPNSPPNFGQRLRTSGLSVFEEFAGLALTDLAAATRPVEGPTVREVSRSERSTFASAFASAFALPTVAVDFLCDCYFFASSGPRARNYLAFIPEERNPIAAATTVYDEATGIVVLAGAAVAPAYRKRGVYTALLHERLVDARNDGMSAAVIQAVRATSAPICRALGFEELCAQTLYASAGDT